MEEITIGNYRCFREKQVAPLAPLTLLIGENSTGKTSFLAMIRALWDVAFGDRTPDFKEDPYDLGSFEEIAHYRGGRGGRAGEFEAEARFDVAENPSRRSKGSVHPLRFTAIFRPTSAGTVPVPVIKRIESGSCWMESRLESGDASLVFSTSNGTWRWPDQLSAMSATATIPLPFLLEPAIYRRATQSPDTDIGPECLRGAEQPTDEDWERVASLTELFRTAWAGRQRPYASAPVRSKPHRTYDPGTATRDPEGEYVPMLLSDIYARDPKRWSALKGRIEAFGRNAGLFDEIAVKRFGTKATVPFKIQVRKFGSRAKGPHRNLIDVGYGVSQVLPVVTEMLRHDAPSTFLLQQPEVHLHPSAQAALGSLFCQVASEGRQVIVETHSDHLLDRVRMDIRDGKVKMTMKDVSLLFFERRNLSVRIHRLGFDEQGNIVGAPDGYRQFFMEEVNRSLGIV